jgi:hypothetical protein
MTLAEFVDYLFLLFKNISPYFWSSLGISICVGLSIIGAAWYDYSSRPLPASPLPTKHHETLVICLSLRSLLSSSLDNLVQGNFYHRKQFGGRCDART